MLLQLHCAFVYVTFELLDTLSDMDNVHWTCSGLLFWSLIYVLRQSALRRTWPGFLPWLSLSQHLTTRLSCTEAQDDDDDDHNDYDLDDERDDAMAISILLSERRKTALHSRS